MFPESKTPAAPAQRFAILCSSSEAVSEIRKIYVAKGPGDAHFLRGLLESAGIEAVVRGDDFVPLQGGSLLRMETRSSVWVLDDEQYPAALEIVEEYVRTSKNVPGPAVGDAWRCGRCGEEVEAQFTACWSCGAERPSSG